MWVKICGTTSLNDALMAVDAGAAAVGFVLSESKRRVSAEQVGAITPHLPRNIMKVGVMTSAHADEIATAVATAGLTAVQLHSRYSRALATTLKARTDGTLRLLQVVDFPAEENEAAEREMEDVLREVREDGIVDAVLLDASVRGTSGGTGVAFDWRRAAKVLEKVWEPGSKMQLGLAGGLNPANVAEAISVLRPDFVDVVSGVESLPGSKDAELVRLFVANAQKHESPPRRA